MSNGEAKELKDPTPEEESMSGLSYELKESLASKKPPRAKPLGIPR